MGLDFSVTPGYIDIILLGVLMTIVITILSTILSIVGGIFFALIELYSNFIFKYPIKMFAFIFMGTPLLLQLYFLYFGLGSIGIELSAFTAGVIGLGLFYAVYNSELIQTAIVTIDKGQIEGARSLGLSKFKTITRVVLPQAFRVIVPTIGNNTIALLKDSSLVSVIGVTELIHASQAAISETYRPFEFYIIVMVCYYLINIFMEFALRRIEQKIEITK